MGDSQGVPYLVGHRFREVGPRIVGDVAKPRTEAGVRHDVDFHDLDSGFSGAIGGRNVAAHPDGSRRESALWSAIAERHVRILEGDRGKAVVKERQFRVPPVREPHGKTDPTRRILVPGRHALPYLAQGAALDMRLPFGLHDELDRDTTVEAALPNQRSSRPRLLVGLPGVFTADRLHQVVLADDRDRFVQWLGEEVVGRPFPPGHALPNPVPELGAATRKGGPQAPGGDRIVRQADGRGHGAVAYQQSTPSRARALQEHAEGQLHRGVGVGFRTQEEQHPVPLPQPRQAHDEPGGPVRQNPAGLPDDDRPGAEAALEALLHMEREVGRDHAASADRTGRRRPDRAVHDHGRSIHQLLVRQHHVDKPRRRRRNQENRGKTAQQP